jgi:N-methylhydantoinase A/oxoprolinase/acetone carboxylase beta subunit
VAEAEMLRALRVMSIERGVDPRELALMPFGGAGPLHACALAQELGITHVLCPRASGVLCALGLAAAPPRQDVSRTVMLAGESFSEQRVHELRVLLTARASVGLEVERTRTTYELRYRGQSFELAIDSDSAAPELLQERFAEAHERRYGYRDEHAPVELVTMRVSAWGPAPALELGASSPREQLAGAVVHPLPQSTLYVPPGWAGVSDEWGTIHLRPVTEGAWVRPMMEGT